MSVEYSWNVCEYSCVQFTAVAVTIALLSARCNKLMKLVAKNCEFLISYLWWRPVIDCCRSERAHESFSSDFIHRIYSHAGKNIFTTKFNIIGEIQEVFVRQIFVRINFLQHTDRCTLLHVSVLWCTKGVQRDLLDWKILHNLCVTKAYVLLNYFEVVADMTSL